MPVMFAVGGWGRRSDPGQSGSGFGGGAMSWVTAEG